MVKEVKLPILFFLVLLCFSISLVEAFPYAEPGDISVAEKTRPLVLHTPLSDTLYAGELHSYEIKVTTNQYIHLQVEQTNINLTIRLKNPEHKNLFETQTRCRNST